MREFDLKVIAQKIVMEMVSPTRLTTSPQTQLQHWILTAMADLINGSRAKARLTQRLGWCLTMTTTTMGWLMRRIFFQRIHEISLTLTGTELETMQTLTLMTPRSNS